MMERTLVFKQKDSSEKARAEFSHKLREKTGCSITDFMYVANSISGGFSYNGYYLKQLCDCSQWALYKWGLPS